MSTSGVGDDRDHIVDVSHTANNIVSIPLVSKWEIKERSPRGFDGGCLCPTGLLVVSPHWGCFHTLLTCLFHLLHRDQQQEHLYRSAYLIR